MAIPPKLIYIFNAISIKIPAAFSIEIDKLMLLFRWKCKRSRRAKTLEKEEQGTSLAVQWLRLRTSTAGGSGLIPGRGTKIPHAVQHGQKKKKNKVGGLTFPDFKTYCKAKIIKTVWH